MKKPDRFERAVDRELLKAGGNGIECDWLAVEDVVKLLRRQHRWVRRMVKKVYEIGLEDGKVKAGRNMACEEILFRLSEYER